MTRRSIVGRIWCFGISFRAHSQAGWDKSENGIDMKSRNVASFLQYYSAPKPKIVTSVSSWRKP